MLFKHLVCGDDQYGSGSLEADAAFYADYGVAYVHVTADAVGCADFFYLLDGGNLVFEYFTVHGMDFTVLEFETEFFAAGLFDLFQISAFRQALCRIKDFATADGSSPQTYIVRIF